jgi:hypothetical protein
MLSTLAPLLIAGSAAILMLIGLLHLLYTFHGPKLLPRDHGLILFGAVYGYLSLAHSAFLLQSMFLLSLGLSLLGGYAFLAKRYWFSVPFRGILLATVFFVIALIINWAQI